MSGSRSWVGWAAVFVAVALGAATYVLLRTIFQVLPLLSRAPATNLVLFSAWVLVSGFVLSVFGVWLYQQVAHRQADAYRLIAAVGLSVPVLEYGGDSFTVLPYVLNINFDFGAFKLGVNFVAIGFGALLYYALKKSGPGSEKEIQKATAVS